MGTHAILAYKNDDGEYVAKSIHYGSFIDNEFYLKDFDSNELIESVNKGDSSFPFAGFYSDEAHCSALGWNHEMYVENILTHRYNIGNSDRRGCLRQRIDSYFRDTKEVSCSRWLNKHMLQMITFNGESKLYMLFDKELVEFMKSDTTINTDTFK